MNTATTKTIEELNDLTLRVAASNQIPVEQIETRITQIVERLRLVKTTVGNQLADVVEHALAQASEPSKGQNRLEKTQVYLWAAGIKLGWV